MAATPSKPVSSLAFLELGPVLISPTHRLDAVAEIAEMQTRFGVDADGRIVSQKLDGRSAFVVVLKLGIYRAVVREITPEIAQAIRPVMWRLRLRGRAIKCKARVDTDPASPTYLDIWLNPGLQNYPNTRRAE